MTDCVAASGVPSLTDCNCSAVSDEMASTTQSICSVGAPFFSPSARSSAISSSRLGAVLAEVSVGAAVVKGDALEVESLLLLEHAASVKARARPMVNTSVRFTIPPSRSLKSVDVGRYTLAPIDGNDVWRTVTDGGFVQLRRRAQGAIGGASDGGDLR